MALNWEIFLPGTLNFFFCSGHYGDDARLADKREHQDSSIGLPACLALIFFLAWKSGVGKSSARGLTTRDK